jgi:hypothetical protein
MCGRVNGLTLHNATGVNVHGEIDPSSAGGSTCCVRRPSASGSGRCAGSSRAAAMGLGAAELAAAKAEQDAIFATADEPDALIAELDGLAVEPSTAKTTKASSGSPL